MVSSPFCSILNRENRKDTQHQDAEPLFDIKTNKEKKKPTAEKTSRPSPTPYPVEQ